MALYNLACVHSVMGDADGAFRWLDTVLEAGLTNVQRLRTDPDLDNIRDDPRFEEVLIRAGAHPRTCERDPTYNQLDFWVGRWEVYDAKGRALGRNFIAKTLMDCLLLQNWQALGESGNGMSVSFFDPGSGKWRQDWVSDRGAVIRYEGERKDGGMYFQGENVAVDGTRELSRMTLSPREDGTVRQFVEQSKDGGKTWYVWFEGNYKPIKDDEDTGAASDE